MKGDPPPRRPALEETRSSQLSPLSAQRLYLELLKKCLTRSVFGENYQVLDFPKGSARRAIYAPLRQLLARFGLELSRKVPFDAARRSEGRDWPAEAETMIGLRRLDNLQGCVETVLRSAVPGDLIETGVWRGGASILIRAVLQAYGDTSRTVWVADSFQGLPKPDPSMYPSDLGDRHWSYVQLAVPLAEVQSNFARYGLLDRQVKFLVGWFSETLPTAPIDQLALLRIDADMYGSTMVALETLYPKLSVGGFVIIDDYGVIKGCRHAVDDFRARQGITEPLEPIDWSGVFWQRRG